MDYSFMSSVKNGKKKCRGCKEWVDVENFDAYKKNGKIYLQYMCKTCRKRYEATKEVRERNRLQQQKHKEKYREQQRIYNTSEHGRELNRKRSKKYWDANPIKNKARKKVRTAIQNGSMVRPDTCSSCGRKCKPEAHHEDYNKPLDVVWLCKECHTETHMNNK